MRRKISRRPTDKNKAFVYVCALVTLGVYAIPRLPALQRGLAGTFSMVWILFAVLSLSANLYFLFGADKERSRMLETYEIQGNNRAGENQMDDRRVRRRSM